MGEGKRFPSSRTRGEFFFTFYLQRKSSLQQKKTTSIHFSMDLSGG
jgi:hypothetical protein